MRSWKEDFQAIFEIAPDAMYIQDAAGTLTRVNRAFEEFTGYSRGEVMGRSLLELVAPEHRRAALPVISENGRFPKRYELAILTRDGDRLVCEITASPLYHDGEFLGKQGSARELPFSAILHTEARLIEKTSELAKFSRYLQLLHRLSTTHHPALDALFADYLAAGVEIFGLKSGAITQKSGAVYSTRASYQTDRPDLYSERVAEELKTLTCSKGREPSCPYAYYIGTPIVVNDQFFGNIGFWDVSVPPEPAHPQAREILELMAKSIGVAINQRNLTDLLAHQARHDSLTGLPNRLLLRDTLDSALDAARESNSQLAVMFIDLDRFKQINDTLGHSIGDGLLQQIAWRLEHCIDRKDHLARMGGDEFTAVLTNIASDAEAEDAARRILAAASRPCRVEGYELFVTASIGISFFPRDGRDAATLLRNADGAMYAAKSRGRNDFACFHLDSSSSTMERLELENYLRRALEREELSVLYQPQVEMNGALAGLELLLLWEHPTLGRVSPAQFIPIAEESGLIVPIGSWVLQKACRQMSEWNKAGLAPVPVSVNVSALQFAHDAFVENVAQTIAGTGADARSLILEITESSVMRDVEQSVRRMSELRKLGVRIAIDDFGTGYSSLSYLRRLPADVLKIDQSFLHESDYGGSLPVIETIVTLAHNMGLSVTAEGVENGAQFDLVQSAKCDCVQGHVFGGALDLSAVEELLRGSRRLERKS